MKSSSAFSSFFTESSPKERKKVIKEVVKVANREQRKLVEKYEKIFGKNKN